MNKRRALVLMLSVSLIMACAVTLGTPVTPTAVPTSTPTVTATSAVPTVDQISTFVALTLAAQQPVATIPILPTNPPTVEMPSIQLEQTQWSGTFRWFGSVNAVTFVIQEVNGDKFIGAMYWTFPQCRVNERVEGDVIQNIATATEQNRWELHPDFQSGDKGGTWLRWTQNENIGGRCYLTISGDWWYGHITSDMHLVGIHFTNDTNTVPDKDATFDFHLTAQ